MFWCGYVQTSEVASSLPCCEERGVRELLRVTLVARIGLRHALMGPTTEEMIYSRAILCCFLS